MAKVEMKNKHGEPKNKLIEFEEIKTENVRSTFGKWSEDKETACAHFANAI